MGSRLDELMLMGINSIATFVPWQAVESDIAHTLPRFLQAVADRKMTPFADSDAGGGAPLSLFGASQGPAFEARCRCIYTRESTGSPDTASQFVFDPVPARARIPKAVSEFFDSDG